MERKTQNTKHGTWNIKQGEKLKPPCSAPRPTPHAPRSGGFSIIETIVAIAVLSITIVAPLTIAQRGLNNSIYARDQVTAFFLAQEAIEYIRNVRDNNNLVGRSQSDDWLRGLETCEKATGCGVDVNAGKIIDCSTDAGKCQLTFDPETRIYGERRNSGDGRPVGGLQDSIFTRKLFITSIDIGTLYPAADMAATVSWKTGKIQKSITVNTRIFDWYPSPL